jgi:hypothetical protein
MAGLLVTALIPANAADTEKSKTPIQSGLQTVGLINPDGAKSIWLIPTSSGDDISGLIAKYPSKMLDGLKFYKVSSWRDTARFLAVVNENQAHTIRLLAENIQKLNKRVGNLEKMKRNVISSGSLDGRVKALEKKVDHMSDGGLP